MSRVMLVAVLVFTGLVGCADDDDAGSCPGRNPGSCQRWSDCVTVPTDPGYGACGGEIYACQDGAWEVIGWCEPFEEEPVVVEVTGPITLHLDRNATTCRGLSAPDPVVLQAGEYTAASGDGEAQITATVSSEWPIDTGELVSTDVEYQLVARADRVVTGVALARVGGCLAQFLVDGSY